ncbi:MAG TPA: hypothetical protein VNU95_13855 [Candidatus Acidoferrales bacterium]|jgi:hypothetical protein|nr:hypothetical protein [Candidatus Acidoferrales bacterium]
MSETDPLSPARNSDLEWQVAALQRQIFLLMLALVVVTATIVFYLFCESRFMGNDLGEIQPQATQIIRSYNQNAQAIQNFRAQMANYAATHQTFQPVMRKYGWAPGATATK